MKIVSGELSLGLCAGIIAAIIVHALCQSAKAPASEAVSESEDVPESKDVAKGSLQSGLGLEYEIASIKGHDYLFFWNYVRGCCVIHAESCPCKSGKCAASAAVEAYDAKHGADGMGGVR